jgi:predicted membrane metal-binding protein
MITSKQKAEPKPCLLIIQQQLSYTIFLLNKVTTPIPSIIIMKMIMPHSDNVGIAFVGGVGGGTP